MWDNELMLQRELESLSPEQLRTLLQAETRKDEPDDDLVLSILHILEDREPEVPDSGSERELAAWKLYKKRIRSRKRRSPGSSGLVKAASVVLVVCLLFAVAPQQAEADSWWDRLTRWTEDFFGFFRQEEEEPFRLEDYEFRTDNPGLQEVYDAVAEMGVTVPVVPMWLPEGYELAECTAVATPAKQYVYARFCHGESTCILQFNVLRAEGAKDYFKDETDVKKHEEGGVVHNLVRNQDAWTVSWTEENIECAFSIDCMEDVLDGIITSIYRWEMNQ